MIDAGKRSVLGILVDVVDYEGAVQRILDAARDGRPMAVSALAVHGVMTAVKDRDLGAKLNAFDLVTPDGQPVRWALNLLHGAGLTDRVYGPELTLRVLAGAAREGLPVFLYGSTPETLSLLETKLQERFPGLKIAGSEPSKFRLAAEGEADAIADRIAGSGARIVLVGLGCPRQEVFAYGMRSRLGMPLLAVGAAFDYHAGLLRKPPEWMQRRGLEWLWRLGQEPGRLWRRYLLLNPAYLARLAAQVLRIRRFDPVPAATEPSTVFPV